MKGAHDVVRALVCDGVVRDGEAPDLRARGQVAGEARGPARADPVLPQEERVHLGVRRQRVEEGAGA